MVAGRLRLQGMVEEAVHVHLIHVHPLVRVAAWVVDKSSLQGRGEVGKLHQEDTEVGKLRLQGMVEEALLLVLIAAWVVGRSSLLGTAMVGKLHP